MNITISKSIHVFFVDDTTILVYDENLNNLYGKRSGIFQNKIFIPLWYTGHPVRKLDYFMKHNRCLGIHLDCVLNFNGPVERLGKKLSSGCNALRAISNELGMTTAKVMYLLFKSHARYGFLSGKPIINNFFRWFSSFKNEPFVSM